MTTEDLLKLYYEGILTKKEVRTIVLESNSKDDVIQLKQLVEDLQQQVSILMQDKTDNFGVYSR